MRDSPHGVRYTHLERENPDSAQLLPEEDGTEDDSIRYPFFVAAIFNVCMNEHTKWRESHTKNTSRYTYARILQHSELFVPSI